MRGGGAEVEEEDKDEEENRRRTERACEFLLKKKPARENSPLFLLTLRSLARSLFNCILLSNFPRGAIDRDTRAEQGEKALLLPVLSPSSASSSSSLCSFFLLSLFFHPPRSQRPSNIRQTRAPPASFTRTDYLKLRASKFHPPLHGVLNLMAFLRYTHPPTPIERTDLFFKGWSFPYLSLFFVFCFFLLMRC